MLSQSLPPEDVMSSAKLGLSSPLGQTPSPGVPASPARLVTQPGTLQEGTAASPAHLASQPGTPQGGTAASPTRLTSQPGTPHSRMASLAGALGRRAQVA